METILFDRLYEYICVYSKINTSLQGILYKNERTGKVYLGCQEDLNTRISNSLESLKSLSKRDINFTEGSMYLIGDFTNAEETDILNTGIQKIFHRSVTESSVLKNAVMYTYEVYDYKYPEKWWTDIFYEKAYDTLKERRKAPFTIISYNNPTVPTLKRFGVDKMTEERNWPFFVFVRTSQKKMYEETLKDYKYVTVVDFPDVLISNAGAVRRASQKWLYQQGYKIAFQGDDDCTLLTYSTKGYCGDGSPKAQYVENTNICQVLAMWQLAMEEAIRRDNVFLSCSMPVGFSWKADYCMSYDSYLLSRGSFTNIVCWNVPGLVENNIYYRDNPEVGLDDIDMEIRVIESGHNLCNFVWLVNNGDPMSSDKTLDELKVRFKECQDKLKAHHGHLEWVHFRPKRNLDQVCVYFPGVRKWQKANGYRDTEDYIYDIWNNGNLLNN